MKSDQGGVYGWEYVARWRRGESDICIILNTCICHDSSCMPGWESAAGKAEGEGYFYYYYKHVLIKCRTRVGLYMMKSPMVGINGKWKSKEILGF